MMTHLAGAITSKEIFTIRFGLNEFICQARHLSTKEDNEQVGMDPLSLHSDLHLHGSSERTVAERRLRHVYTQDSVHQGYYTTSCGPPPPLTQLQAEPAERTGCKTEEPTEFKRVTSENHLRVNLPCLT